MDSGLFIDINLYSALALFVVGFVGGMVSGFIGSGGAFVLTPAMMTLGVPGIVAVASNMCHKFPKSLVGAMKRHKYGQVDLKLGIIMGVFAELGVIAGKHVMTGIKDTYGDIGTSLYVSVVFVVVLAVVGGFVLRDALHMFRRERAGGGEAAHPVTRLARWIQSVHIPGTMVYFDSLKARVSVLFIVPLGLATGMLAATIAVGGFIGVPAMIYVLGAPALMASATELVVAFVMGVGGTLLYALDGVVDIRLAMIILAGSLFGIQIGAIGTTYVRDSIVKLVMGLIMIIVLFSRFFYVPGYLSKLGMITPLSDGSIANLKLAGDATLVLALAVGGLTILVALIRGMAEHRQAAVATRSA
ncbi:MAG TPA: sulfite exporter TauE/SafE family protein [Thiobacillaceae bacterium]|nr:sulfite exporter TauE/SafE family protein [Thiobacillaceae bacterium]HNU65106.1 sulfite exporter TauE/SafE family protein [Thiobacillaceae bacterium]